jgi:thiosulfate/3-mercaptopyruvate sulfurtransferase
MHYAGHLAARLLDGGIAAWRAEGAPLTTDPTPIDPAPFAVRGRRELIARIDEIEPAIADPATVIVDARSTDEYAANHLEGAIHLPHELFLAAEGGRFADLETLRPDLEALGIERRTPLLVYSNASRRSALVAVALRHLGHRKVKNFLGGWQEWSRRDGSAA